MLRHSSQPFISHLPGGELICHEEMEPDRRAKALEQAAGEVVRGAAQAPAAGRAEARALAEAEAAWAASPWALAATAYAPAVDRQRPTKWASPAPRSSARSVASR